MSKQFDSSPDPPKYEQEARVPEHTVGGDLSDKKACPSIFDDPADSRYRKKEAKRRTGSSRYVINVLISLVLCAVLILGVVFLVPLFKTDDNGTSDTSSIVSSVSSAANTILNDDERATGSNGESDSDGLGNIKSISVKNETGSYTLKSYWGTEETVDATTGGLTTVDALKWNITKVAGKNIEGVTFSSSTLNFLVSDLQDIAYESVYTQDKNATIPQGNMTYLEECGLNDSKVRLTMHYGNGTSKTLILGNKTPVGTGYYVCFEQETSSESVPGQTPVEDNKIYIVSEDAVVFFLKNPIYFVDKNIITAVEQAEDTYDENGDLKEDPYFIAGALSYFDELSLSGLSYEKDFVFEIVEEDKPGYDSIYLMTSPYTQNVDLTAMETLLTPVASGFTAYNCLSMNATDKEIAKYGLDDPACIARYVVKNKEYVLKIGLQTDKENNYYAVMVNGNPSIFEASADDLVFSTYDAADFASSTIYSCEITKIATIRAQMDGFDETFYLDHGTDTYGEATIDVTTGKGVSVDEAAFRDMYMDLLSLTSFTNVTDGKDAKSPYLTLTITYNDYAQVDVLRLSPYTDRRYFMSLNGMGSTVILSTSVDAVVSSITGLIG